jgi:general secretion pathway protein D
MHSNAEPDGTKGAASPGLSVTEESESTKGIPQIATSVTIQLTGEVRRADDAALRGSQLMADGDYEGAVNEYKNALDLLPNAPMTLQRQRAYVKHYSRAATALARSYADRGRYDDAIGLIEDVLRPSIASGHIPAKQFLEQLADPEYYSVTPAKPQFLKRIQKLNSALKAAQEYLDTADIDRVEQEYQKILNPDRSRAIEKSPNVDDRDSRRAAFLRQVAEGWEAPNPAAVTVASQRNITKLTTIFIPSLRFSDTPLSEALLFIQKKSVELDIAEPDITKKGVKIILKSSPKPEIDGVESGGEGIEKGGNPRITLHLGNVSIAEALSYTTGVAQMKFRVEADAIVVEPRSNPDAE